MQERRLQQIANSARSLQILGEQSSVYVPMSNSPAKLPKYLSLDATSLWHVAALQVVGLESMTMSSRLRSTLGGRGTLQDLENTINSTGKRRIAKFGTNIADPDVLSDKAFNEARNAEKVGSTISRQTGEGNQELANFDIDVFTRDYRSARGKGKKEHIFGRAEATRGEWSVSEACERDPHDRFYSGPAVQRYVIMNLFMQPLSCSQQPCDKGSYTNKCANFLRFATPLLFPLLDSFPKSIFDVGTGNATKLAVHTGLTTSTAVAEQIRAVEQLVKRLVGIEEREALCNGLQVLAEEYDEGWDSGTDSDDDE